MHGYKKKKVWVGSKISSMQILQITLNYFKKWTTPVNRPANNLLDYPCDVSSNKKKQQVIYQGDF